MGLKNFRRNYRLLNSIESISVAYLLMIFSLIISNHRYLRCLDCGLGYRFQVSLMLIINFGSYQILTINAYLQKQRKQIKLLKKRNLLRCTYPTQILCLLLQPSTHPSQSYRQRILGNWFGKLILAI